MSDLDYITQEARATTLSGAQMVKRYGADTSRWPAGHWRNLLDRVAKITTPTPATMVVGLNLYPGQKSAGAAFSSSARVDRGQPSDYAGLSLVGIVSGEFPWIAGCPVVEVANEPYYSGQDPAVLARQFVTTAKSVAATNPTAKILLPLNLTNNGDYLWNGKWSPWLTLLLDAVPDLLTHFHGAAVHPYGDGRAPASAPKMLALDTVRAQLTAAGSSMLFYATELGYTTGPSKDNAPIVSEAVQAQYLGDQLRILRDRGDVAGVWIFLLQDTSYPWAYGLLRIDGTAKPAYQVAKGYVGA